MADPILDLTDAQKNTVIDPQVAATQLGNLLHIIAGTGGATDLATMTTPTSAPSAPGTSTTSTQSFTMPDPQHTAHSGEFGEQRSGHAHAGIDFEVPMGSTILSAAPGVVSEVGGGGGYGNFVLVDHGNGYVTRYAHLTNATVKVGDKVSGGQQIGISGSTGQSTGPHLHFEVIKDGTPIDPNPLLAGGAVLLGDAQGKPLKPEDVLAAQIGNTIDILSGNEPTEQTTTAEGATTTGQGGDFFGQVLAGVGAPDTPENRRALEAWARAEGMDVSANNPFATTWDTEGGDESINSAGVRRYADVALGVTATVNTLRNYPGIVGALKAGDNAMAVADAIAASPWGTGALVGKILRGG